MYNYLYARIIIELNLSSSMAQEHTLYVLISTYQMNIYFINRRRVVRWIPHQEFESLVQRRRQEIELRFGDDLRVQNTYRRFRTDVFFIPFCRWVIEPQYQIMLI